MDIPAYLIDVDFGSVAPSLGKLTGCKPRETVCGEEHPVYEDTHKLIPRSEWEEAASKVPDLLDYSPYQHDQDGEGSCASNAAAGCHESQQVRQLGLDQFVPLSAVSLYCRVGSSASSGSTMPSNLREITRHGILPLDTPDNRRRFAHVHPHNGFRLKLPSGWEETGVLFRGFEWDDIASLEGIVTSILTGNVVAYARDGHAIKAVQVIPERQLIKYHNSWGDWGDNGCGYDSFSKVAAGIRQYGAWNLRAIVIPEELRQRLGR